MKNIRKLTILLYVAFFGFFPFSAHSQAQTQEVVISGARFTNILFEKWISDYQKLYPDVKFRFDNKGAAEFSDADIIVHGHELDKSQTDKSRKYYPVAKYAILPIANANSPFANAHGKKGLTNNQIKQVFFYDPLAGDRKGEINIPYNVYTRVQQAPAPAVFAAKFGYVQADLQGRAIAGADIHLIKAVLRDSLGVTYCPVPLIYSSETGFVLDGLKVIPVDFDGNNRVSDDERFYEDLPTLLHKLSGEPSENVPVAEIKISLLEKNAKVEAVQFVNWILNQGQEVLAEYGYIKLDIKALQSKY